MHRIIGIDIIRAFSMLWIVGFWHLLNYTDALPNYNNPITVMITRFALGSFVFISGYLIGIKYSSNTLHLQKFFRSRFLRIYPLYFFSIVVFSVLYNWSLDLFLKASFFLSMFSPPAPPTLWFITMIGLFYILSPMISILIQKMHNIYIYHF